MNYGPRDAEDIAAMQGKPSQRAEMLRGRDRSVSDAGHFWM
jgi:hypothetical protein